MKKLILIFLITVSATAFGQTAKKFLQSGIEKHRMQDFQGAIIEYSKAINLDNKNRDAYYNRGICEFALDNIDEAKKDFNKTIELDPKYADAYYTRSRLFVKLEKYEDALADLDKVINLDPSIPSVFTIRGQIRAQTGNKKGACEDFQLAKSKGDSQADKFLSQYCGNEQQRGESLMLHWPEKENWKVADEVNNKDIQVLRLVQANETLDNWTEIGTMFSIKGIINSNLDSAMNMMYEEAQAKAGATTLTFIEKDEKTKFPWILFTIEPSASTKDKNAESQLWFIIQGKDALYCNYRAVKSPKLSKQLKDKWIRFFKSAKILYK
ncbi:MAG: tetratricopeptide repeat protein [Ignavibacteriae bacterium]|nr:tetratricopeptide repeat protein [Ignavibacteriota bacterium]